MSFKEPHAGKISKKVAGFLAAGAIAVTCSPGQEESTQALPSTPTPITRPIATVEPTLMPTLTVEPILQPTPTNTPRSEPTSTVEAKAEEISFVFGEGVTAEQQKEIKDGIIMAREWFFAKTGIKINDVSVFAFASSDQLVDQYLQRTIDTRPHDVIQKELTGATAFVGQKEDMFINTSSPGWTNASPIIDGPIPEGRLHTLAHEWIHIFQRKVGGYNRPFPHWLNEGGAHYAAARTLDENKVYSYKKIRDGHVREASGVKENLASMETAQGFYGAGQPWADEYSLAELATEFLTNGLPNEGIPAIANFWQGIGKGNPWQTAFKTAFGQTPDEFYPKFEQLRQNGFR